MICNGFEQDARERATACLTDRGVAERSPSGSRDERIADGAMQRVRRGHGLSARDARDRIGIHDVLADERDAPGR